MNRLIGLLFAMVLVTSACSDGAGDSSGTTLAVAPTVSDTTTTTAATTTTAEAATGPLELVGTYDGEDCSYVGPETASLDDEVGLTLVNESADAVFLKMFLIPPDRLAEIEPLVGSNTVFSGGRTTALNPTLYAESGPFVESSARSFLPAPGTYVVECTLVEGATPIHVWWLAALSVDP